MGTCTQNLLTALSVLLALGAGVFIVQYLKDAYYSMRKFFNAFSVGEFLVPAAAVALAIFLVRYEMPKHVEIVDCGTGQKVENVAMNLTCPLIKKG